MATTTELRAALKRAASALVNRELNDIEIDRLISTFDKAKGTNYERALEALTEGTKLSRPELMQKAAASDNTDRAMKDLKNTVINWKPGS